MNGAYYFVRVEDSFFMQLKLLLSPLVTDVLRNKPHALHKAIRLMHASIIKIPPIYFKDAVYANEIFSAIDLYLAADDQSIKKIARKRRTDRLEVRRTIASDCLEYLSFMPMQLEADPRNIHRYEETMDNILSLLRGIEADEDHFKKLQLQFQELN